jgi:hypothetical protein
MFGVNCNANVSSAWVDRLKLFSLCRRPVARDLDGESSGFESGSR